MNDKKVKSWDEIAKEARRESYKIVLLFNLPILILIAYIFIGKLLL